MCVMLLCVYVCHDMWMVCDGIYVRYLEGGTRCDEGVNIRVQS